ncbi:MAG: ABC transporter ATP-binding protein [Pirellulaceae bacterium]
MTAAISIFNVTKRFGSHVALDDVSIDVKSGSVLGLLGPNGAGKSTLLKLVVNLLRPNAGQITILGRSVFEGASPIKSEIGYVAEEPRLYPWMTVKEVISFTSGFFANWDTGFQELLRDTYSLPMTKKVRQLSKGMRAKLGLLLALSHRPSVLILDEPMSGLDPVARDDFVGDILDAIALQCPAVILSSHLLADVQRIATEIAILCNGRLLAKQPIDKLLQTTRRIRVILEDGRLPTTRPGGLIWECLDRREWLVTIGEFTNQKLDELKNCNHASSVEILEVGLEDLYKDFIRGAQFE